MAEAAPVGDDGVDVVLDDEAPGAAARRAPGLVDDRLELQRLPVDDLPAEPREGEHVVDEFLHPVEGALDVVQMLAVAVVGNKFEARGGDAEWAPEVVTDHACELLHPIALPRQLLGALLAFALVAHPVCHQLDERHLPVRERLRPRVVVVETEGAGDRLVDDDRRAEIAPNPNLHVALPLCQFGFVGHVCDDE